MKVTRESLEKINERLNDIVDLTDFDIARQNGKTIKKIYDIDSANIPKSAKKLLISKEYIKHH